MSQDEERIRTVEDAGAEAIALFRKIDAERAENPVARPAVLERVIARIIDSVVHGLIIIVAVTSYTIAANDQPQGAFNAGAGTGSTAPPAGAPAWGPASIEWKVALLLGATVVAIAASEVVQTRLLGATFGMKRSQMRVHSVHGGGPASLAQTAVRSAALALPFVFMLGLGASSVVYAFAGLGMVAYVSMSCFRDDRQRGFHDRIAGTEVFSTDVRG